MEKTKKIKIELRDIVILILLTLILVTVGNKRNINIDNPYSYLPDTVYLDNGYKDRITKLENIIDKLVKTPPQKVIIHKPGNNTNTHTKTIIEKIPDSIIILIDSLSKKIKIADSYLKYYPENPKLIDFKLSMESFDLSTMGITGNIYQNQYPLYLHQFDYYWVENELVRVERDKPFLVDDENKWKNLYINAGYDFIRGNPQLKLEYDLKFYRFRVKPEVRAIIGNNTYFEGNIFLGYRLLD